MNTIFDECVCHGKRLYPFGGVSVRIQDEKIEFVDYPSARPEKPGDDEPGDKEPDTDEPIGDGPVKVGLTVSGEEKVGEIVTTKVSLVAPEEYEGKMVRVRVTITPAGANKPKYKEGDEWKDLPMVSEGDAEKDVFYFGASAGFPLTAGAESEFSNELVKSGPVTTTLEVIDVETGEVISTASQTVDVKE